MDALKPTAGNSYNYNSADSPHNLHNRPQGQNFEKVSVCHLSLFNTGGKYQY